MKNYAKISSVLVIFATYGTSLAQPIHNQGRDGIKTQAFLAAKEAAAKRVEESQSKAGDSASPQMVEASEIPTFERLQARMRMVTDQLKPEFLGNMKIPPEVETLTSTGCQPERTIPIGLEFEPGRLDGTFTLFKCSDGQYGQLVIRRLFKTSKNFVISSQTAKNDWFGATAAVGRYMRTNKGATRSILRWDNTKGQSVSLDLMAAEPPGGGAQTMNLMVSPVTRIKQIAETINSTP